MQAATALGPLQRRKRVRLLRARSMLIAGEGDATAVAFRVGHQSATRFSREYARQLGSPPSRDALRLWRP
ncbi:helix-turn-helix domain-containing protein [Albimonas pacifica]|uniref:helix-turn-helix domain-containing protein n=1 Tax=Albimonas pacifica TaxID=1114924 RepID=UPI003CCC22E3